MLRTATIAILIVAGSALGALLLCALTLRILLSGVFALSGIRRRMTHSKQVLDW
jgi:hypothetical protein